MGINQFSGAANEVLVYNNQGNIEVKMQKETIATIKVYDLSGRLLLTKNQINTTTTTIDNLKSSRQVLILQITTHGGVVINKKVIL